jgi:hypothetical protein
MTGAITWMNRAIWEVVASSNAGARSGESHGATPASRRATAPAPRIPTRKSPAAIRQAATSPSVSARCTNEGTNATFRAVSIGPRNKRQTALARK